jgi:hypothetical protein
MGERRDAGPLPSPEGGDGKGRQREPFLLVRNIRHFDELGFGIVFLQELHELLVVISFIRLLVRLEQPPDLLFLENALKIIRLLFVVVDAIVKELCLGRHVGIPFLNEDVIGEFYLHVKDRRIIHF